MEDSGKAFYFGEKISIKKDVVIDGTNYGNAIGVFIEKVGPYAKVKLITDIPSIIHERLIPHEALQKN